MGDQPDDRLVPDAGRRGFGSAPPPPAGPEADEDAPAPPAAASELLLPRAAVRLDSARCPYCLRLIETFWFGLRSRLGPSLLECPSCRRVFLSHRREWADMSSVGKTWVVLVSALYAAGLAGAAVAATRFGLFLVRAALPHWVVAAHALGWAAAVVIVQCWRVARSVRRGMAVQRAPHRPSPWGPDLGWALRFLTGVVATSAALAWLAHVLKW